MALNFGNPSASGTPLAAGFGTTSGQPPAFNFGGGGLSTNSSSAAAPPAFNFGQSATGAAAAPAASTGFSLGAPPSSTATVAPTLGGFGGFGSSTTSATTAAAPAAAGGFGGFGAAAAPAASTAGGLGGFGAATSTTGSLGGFGAATSTAGGLGGFGAATSTAGGLGGFGAATSTAGGLGGFGAATSTAGGLGGFGAATSTAGGLGGFGAATSTAGGLGGFGAATATAGAFGTAPTPAATTGLGGNTTAPAFGLGGLGQQHLPAATAGQQIGGQTENKGAEAANSKNNPKENMIPAELATTVEELRRFIKEEKGVSSDIGHVSDKQYTRIREETEALSQLVTVLATGLQKNRVVLDRLKLESAQELLNVEMCQRTKETPASMQYENTAPMDYFIRLVAQFEQQMGEYRKQIEETEQHLQVSSAGGVVSSADIAGAVKRLHEAFTELAAKYHTVHQAIAEVKEKYIAIHRRKSGCSAPVFEKKSVLPVKTGGSLPKLSGPSPFSDPSDPLLQARAALLPHRLQQAGTGQPGPPTLGLNSSATPAGGFGSFSGGGTGGTGTGFGNTTSFAANSSFGGGNVSFGGSNVGFGGSNVGFGGSNVGFGGNTTNNTTLGGAFGSPLAASSSNNNNSTLTGFGASPFNSASASFDYPAVGNKRNKH